MNRSFQDPGWVRVLYKDQDRIRFRGMFLKTHSNSKISLRTIAIRLLPSRRYSSVLDVGCGNGTFIEKLHKRWPRGRFVGLDTVRNRHCEALEFLDYRIYRGGSIPVGVGYFDLIVCMHTMYHIPRFGPFLRSLRAQLAPRGVVLVTTKSKYTLPKLEGMFRRIVKELNLERRMVIPKARPESRFCLENGMGILQRVFDDTKFTIREETVATQLIIEDIPALRRYVRSTSHYHLSPQLNSRHLATRYARLWRRALRARRPFLDYALEGIFMIERRK